MAQVGQSEIANRFGFHPTTDETREKHQRVREAFIDLACELDEMLPAGRESALVLTHLQQASMWANAAIACNLAPLKLGE